MASVGHLAVGLAAARASSDRRTWSTWSAMAVWCAISLVPDLDFVGLLFGIPPDSLWGHRGATHSLGTAALGAVAAALVAERLGQRVRRTAALVAAVLISHPLLDAMTWYGPGCALLWPFDSTRYKLPWHAIPTVPTAAAVFAPAALPVIARELVLFLPLLVFAFWPVRRDYDGRR